MTTLNWILAGVLLICIGLAVFLCYQVRRRAEAYDGLAGSESGSDSYSDAEAGQTTIRLIL